MKSIDFAFPKARIPYGAWGTSYFPAWQSSALAEVNIGQFAGEAMGRILGKRRISARRLDYLVVGSTIPWRWKFWNAPMLAAIAGHRIPGCHVEQACATGLKAVVHAVMEIQSGSFDAVGVLTFDRASDSSVGIFPERRSPARTLALNDVWDNFGFDPAAGGSMLVAAGNTARKHKIERKQVDEMTAYFYQQYFETKTSGFFDRVAVPLEVLDLKGNVQGRIDEDIGVRSVTLDALRGMRELAHCVTSGTQTHPSDGLATLLVTSEAKARELSSSPDIDIQLVAKAYIRAEPTYMPEAPALAVAKLLQRTGLTMDDIAVVKSHNPFTVNDAVFAKVHNYDWKKMNRTGCSLVWGHPQGPTLTRIIIEALEETVMLGGGYALVLGCAAGDIGVAAVFKVC
jgi:acetyl-CoA C-acetyltransferase